MKRALALLLVLLVAVAGCKKSAPEQSARLNYPKTRTVAQVDDYHGTKVPDPYRWLEDDNAPDTKAWVEAQNKLTFDYLGRLGDTRQEIYERMEELLAYERRGVPEREGENYFFTINEGLQEQSVLHVTGGKAGSGDPRVLARCWPTPPPRPAPTGARSGSATSRPASTWGTTSSTSSSAA
jgi:prolyl oligopeptidase